MKNYRLLVPIVLALLLVVSWYRLISAKAESNEEYNAYITQAREYAEKGITKYALNYYNLALEARPSVDLYVEVAQYYKAQDKPKEFLSWAELALSNYPTDAKAYDCALEAYMLAEDYELCYDIIEMAMKRGVSSSYLTKIENQIQYYYCLDFNTYDDVGNYSNNYCAVMDEEKWGFVDRYGELRVSCRYPIVGAYTKSNFVSVVNKDGEAYFIDKSGSKVLVFDKKYVEFGLLADDMIAAKTDEGTYEYIKQDGTVLLKGFEYASTMNGGVATIVEDGKWYLINTEGKKITEQAFESVVLDEKNIVQRNGRIFVKNSDNKYIMLDSEGKQIGKETYEDAKLFSSSSYAAVKVDGQWAFIDKDGKYLSNKRYEDARSFNNGLAAVKINGKWGFVDEKEELCIDAIYDGAKDFNEKGSCFVKIGDTWKLLKIYRLNR